MKKLILAGLLILIVIIPNSAFAGWVYSPTVEATFYNEAKFTTPGLRGAKGSANISYFDGTWTVSINFSGLLKNHDYIFQFGVQGQLTDIKDCYFTSDKSGKLIKTFEIYDLDLTFPEGVILDEGYEGYEPDEGYTILRLIDLSGKSGGMVLADLEPTSETNPYLPEYPNATMVMRARQDGYRGSLIFY